MLQGFNVENTLSIKNLFPLPPVSSEVQKIVQNAQTFLSQVSVPSSFGTKESRELRGLLCSLNNIACENSEKLASGELWAIIQDKLYLPHFHEFALDLLRSLERSHLPHAEQAAELLNQLSGQGGWAESLQLSLTRVKRSGELVSLSLSMMGAGLVGKGVQALATPLARRWGLARFGDLAVRAAGAGAGLSAELSTYPGMHALSTAVLGGEGAWSHYGEQVLSGLPTILTLRAVGLASRTLSRATHGISHWGEPVKRLRYLRPVTHQVIPVGGELLALGALGYATNPEQNFSFHLAIGLGSLLEFRFAGHLGAASVPGLHQVYRRLDMQAYLAARSRALGLWQSLGTKTASRIQSDQAQLAFLGALGAAIPSQKLGVNLPSGPRIRAEEFISKMAGYSGRDSRGKLPVQSPISEPAQDGSKKAKPYWVLSFHPVNEPAPLELSPDSLMDVLAALSFIKRAHIPRQMLNFYEERAFAPLIENLKYKSTALFDAHEPNKWIELDRTLYAYLWEAQRIFPDSNLFKFRYPQEFSRYQSIIGEALQNLESIHGFNPAEVRTPELIANAETMKAALEPGWNMHSKLFWEIVSDFEKANRPMKPFAALSYPSFMRPKGSAAKNKLS